MNRRKFLATGAAVATSPATLSALPGDSGPIKLAVATYSLRSFKRPEAIKMIQALNIKYADVKDFHLAIKDGTPETWKAGAKEFHDAGIKLVACGNVDMKKPEELRRAFEYAKAAGFPTIVCAPTQAQLPEIEKLVKEFNIKIAIHNHGPEDKFMPTPQSVLEAVKGMDPRMGLCIDIGHTARTGADNVEWIAKAGDRLHEMHFKDLKDPNNADPMVARASQVDVGDGVLPIPAIFQQLAKQKYKGYCSLEYEINAKDPMAGMQKSFAYMRKVISELKLG
ncbi:MAG: sugar phosphate isomerase/epimerase [Bryobacteraceae bacterium]|nr:sugar phosphate isomerase/epimerase [Bryobacteraceae bacterium]